MSIGLDEDGLRLWKKCLPALAERCRTWTHNPKTCEYAKHGATVPLSLKHREAALCFCGLGKFPNDYLDIPNWETVGKKYSTRLAISRVFSAPFVEEGVDPKIMTMLKEIEGAASEQKGTDGKGRECRRCCKQDDAGTQSD
jgi:hypothetical protein